MSLVLDVAFLSLQGLPWASVSPKSQFVTLVSLGWELCGLLRGGCSHAAKVEVYRNHYCCAGRYKYDKLAFTSS